MRRIFETAGRNWIGVDIPRKWKIVYEIVRNVYTVCKKKKFVTWVLETYIFISLCQYFSSGTGSEGKCIEIYLFYTFSINLWNPQYKHFDNAHKKHTHTRWNVRINLIINWDLCFCVAKRFLCDVFHFPRRPISISYSISSHVFVHVWSFIKLLLVSYPRFFRIIAFLLSPSTVFHKKNSSYWCEILHDDSKRKMRLADVIYG